MGKFWSLSDEVKKKISKRMIGNKNGENNVGWLLGKKGYTNSGSFKKGSTSWCKGKKGIHLSPLTEFKKGMSGEKSSHWNGGKSMHDLGYVRIYSTEHPFANGCYVFEHRLAVEKALGRYLQASEIVHHVNEKKDDNRIKNLMCFSSKRAHVRFHKNPDNVKPEEILFDGRTL